MVGHINDKEEKESFLRQVASAAPVLDRYRELIEKKITKTEDTNNTDYDCPSWSHKQADDNGYLRAMKELLRLLPNDKEGNE